MKHIELYALKPANRTAARVVSQAQSVDDAPLSKQELVQLSNRLLRKQRLIKLVLGITTRAQHKNLINNFIRGKKNIRADKEPRLVAEYKRVGEAIDILAQELARQRNERRIASEEAMAAAQAKKQSLKDKKISQM
ncbi:MAG: hypothetical protein EOO52_13335 [Gammaproteobacteria bacterium]|nr:MAG: hypothetical protein EOO52_13335 [Gammaproteobacteria bacterium]